MAVEWNIVDEIRLLRWVSEFKPVGIHKHFHMFCILERMNNPDKYPVTMLQKENSRPAKVFSAKDVWNKLKQYYNLEEADRLENDLSDANYEKEFGRVEQDNQFNSTKLLKSRHKLATQNRDFALPWDEYGELILANAKNHSEDISETNATSKESSVEKESINEKGSGYLKESNENIVKKKESSAVDIEPEVKSDKFIKKNSEVKEETNAGQQLEESVTSKQSMEEVQPKSTDNKEIQISEEPKLTETKQSKEKKDEDEEPTKEDSENGEKNNIKVEERKDAEETEDEKEQFSEAEKVKQDEIKIGPESSKEKGKDEEKSSSFDKDGMIQDKSIADQEGTTPSEQGRSSELIGDNNEEMKPQKDETENVEGESKEEHVETGVLETESNREQKDVEEGRKDLTEEKQESKEEAETGVSSEKEESNTKKRPAEEEEGMEGLESQHKPKTKRVYPRIRRKSLRLRDKLQDGEVSESEIGGEGTSDHENKSDESAEEKSKESSPEAEESSEEEAEKEASNVEEGDSNEEQEEDDGGDVNNIGAKRKLRTKRKSSTETESEPLAKRTRHSSHSTIETWNPTSSTRKESNEEEITSPKRGRKKQSKPTGPARVSSRLRHRK